MTKYQEELIKFYTKDWRKPVFIENAFDINEDTPINDILYTYSHQPSKLKTSRLGCPETG